MRMRINFLDHDHEFTLELPRRPKKGQRMEHGGEEYIIDGPCIFDGREVFKVRGPRSLQASIDGMAEFAKMRAQDD